MTNGEILHLRLDTTITIVRSMLLHDGEHTLNGTLLLDGEILRTDSTMTDAAFVELYGQLFIDAAFGELYGQILVIIKGLYRFKTLLACFHTHLSSTRQPLRYKGSMFCTTDRVLPVFIRDRPPANPPH